MASEWPSSAKTPSLVAIVVGYGLALAVLVLPLVGGGSLLLAAEIPGSIALAAAVALPPTLAVMARPHRPTLLIGAALISIAALFLYPLLGFPMAVLGALWLWAYSRVQERGEGRPLLRFGAMMLVVFLWLAAVVVPFLYADPRCAEELADGTVRMTDPAEQGLVTGWIWDVPAVTSGEAFFSGEVVASECTSDVVTWGEALLSLLLSGSAFGLGVATTGRFRRSAA